MNNKYMKEAIKMAYKAYSNGDIPVGCVIVHDGKIIAKAYNRKEMLNDPTMHAEIIAISKAAKVLKSWRLNDCKLYVTLEPCDMCKGAIAEARINKIYYLLDSKYHKLNSTRVDGFYTKLLDIYNYRKVMGAFFKNKR